MFVRYIGDPANSSGPTRVTVNGVSFPLNLDVYVPPEHEAKFVKLRANKYFLVVDKPPSLPDDPEHRAKMEAMEAALREKEAELAAMRQEEAREKLLARPEPVPTPEHFKPPAPGAGAPSRQGGANLLPGLGGSSLPPPPSQVKKD